MVLPIQNDEELLAMNEIYLQDKTDVSSPEYIYIYIHVYMRSTWM
jgi:hypothetical protein